METNLISWAGSTNVVEALEVVSGQLDQTNALLVCLLAGLTFFAWRYGRYDGKLSLFLVGFLAVGATVNAQQLYQCLPVSQGGVAGRVHVRLDTTIVPPWTNSIPGHSEEFHLTAQSWAACGSASPSAFSPDSGWGYSPFNQSSFAWAAELVVTASPGAPVWACGVSTYYGGSKSAWQWVTINSRSDAEIWVRITASENANGAVSWSGHDTTFSPGACGSETPLCQGGAITNAVYATLKFPASLVGGSSQSVLWTWSECVNGGWVAKTNTTYNNLGGYIVYTACPSGLWQTRRQIQGRSVVYVNGAPDVWIVLGDMQLNSTNCAQQAFYRAGGSAAAWSSMGAAGQAQWAAQVQQSGDGVGLTLYADLPWATNGQLWSWTGGDGNTNWAGMIRSNGNLYSLSGMVDSNGFSITGTGQINGNGSGSGVGNGFGTNLTGWGMGPVGSTNGTGSGSSSNSSSEVTAFNWSSITSGHDTNGTGSDGYGISDVWVRGSARVQSALGQVTGFTTVKTLIDSYQPSGNGDALDAGCVLPSTVNAHFSIRSTSYYQTMAGLIRGVVEVLLAWATLFGLAKLWMYD